MGAMPLRNRAGGPVGTAGWPFYVSPPVSGMDNDSGLTSELPRYEDSYPKVRLPLDVCSTVPHGVPSRWTSSCRPVSSGPVLFQGYGRRSSSPRP